MPLTHRTPTLHTRSDCSDRRGSVSRDDCLCALVNPSRTNAIFQERTRTMFRLTTPITRTLSAAAFLGAVALAGPALAASSSVAATPIATESAAKPTHMDRVEKRIGDLHAKLHISAAQESQWASVAQAMRDNAKSMDTLIKERTANAKAMTAIDDLRSYAKLAEAHEDGLKKFIPVFQALYDSMSDEQKKNADATFRSHESHERHKRT